MAIESNDYNFCSLYLGDPSVLWHENVSSKQIILRMIVTNYKSLSIMGQSPQVWTSK